MTPSAPDPVGSGDLHPTDHPVRDQHGRLLPNQGTPPTLSAAQVDQGLAALPGWERQGASLARRVQVEPASRAGLREGVQNVAGRQHVRFAEEDAGITILLGRGADGLTPGDLEAAARVDAVLSGSGTDRGRAR